MHIPHLLNYGFIFDVGDQIFIALIIQIIRHFICFFGKLRSKEPNPLKGCSIFSLLSAEESSGRRVLRQGKKSVCCRKPQIFKVNALQPLLCCSQFLLKNWRPDPHLRILITVSGALMETEPSLTQLKGLLKHPFCSDLSGV